MVKTEYLTMKQIEILLKCYYLRKYTNVVADENLTPDKVKRIKENALRIIRLAYSASYRNGLRFDGETVLQHMAKRADMETETLATIFENYILDGLASDDKKYWERIRSKETVPTPADLLNFLYDKFEIDIEGFI